MSNGFFKVLISTLILLIFILDLNTKLGFTIGVLYIIPVIITGFYRKKQVVFFIAVFCILLIAGVFYIYLEDRTPAITFNRIISCFALIITSIIFYFKEQILKISITEFDGLEKQSNIFINQIEDNSIILTDQEGRINSWNKGAELMFGYVGNEIIGENISFLYHNLEDKVALRSLLKTIISNKRITKQLWLKRKDGSIFLSEFSLKQIILNNKPIGISVLIHDIDKNRRLEQMLNATNSLAKVGGWEYDLTTNNLYWSPTTREIHEADDDYVPTTENGINFYLEGEDRNHITMVFNKMVKDGTPFEEELRIKTLKNNIIWVRTKAYPVYVNGKCVKIYGSFQNINDKKIQELALKASERRFKNIFNYSASGMARININGNILEANERYYKIVGYSKDEMVNKTFKDITHPEDLDRDIDLFSKLNRGAIKHFEVEKRFYSGTGQLKWANLAASKVRKNTGETDYFIVQLTDITDRKIAEEKLVEKNNELKQYTYITSHDLQEPVRTITSFTEMFSNKYSASLDETGLKYLRFINEASLRLKKQIKGLLDYSRLGRDDKAPSLVNLNDLIEEVKLNLTLLIKENNAIIQFTNLPSIKVYDDEFKLLIQNLISNSIKFQKQDNQPFISISVVEKREYWEFEFTDNGIGIDPKFHDKIFQIFQRLHSNRDFEGSGIGLAHCKKIIEHHNGQIWIKSTLGEGTTFYFTINKYLT